jgi:2-oxoisovalerate dehydrogenase E2 component (dihydrolipoyl transacylase)
VVRNLATEHGIDLAAVNGTGMGGRITKDDVLAYLEMRGAGADSTSDAGVSGVAQGHVTRDMVLEYAERRVPAPTIQPGVQQAVTAASRQPDPGSEPMPSLHVPEASSGPAGARLSDETAIPLTAMRRAIAEHMARSKSTAPHATTVTEVDMTRLVRWRDANKGPFRALNGFDISYVAFVIHAAIQGLRAFPLLNSSWGGDTIIIKKRLNVGIAVGLEDGLLVPVIHGADERSMVGIAKAVSDLAERARNGRLTVHEVQGGTFTVNNTGVFGSIVSTPVINQPQAAILSMEAIVKRPVVIEDAIAIRSMMNICLSFDHRIVDGLMAGRFNQIVRDTLEQAAAVGQA